MYLYVYDTFLTDRKYERVMAEIETRLTDLGITGRIGRLNPFTNAKGLVRDEARRGARTIVVVGNDATVSQVVSGLPTEPLQALVSPVRQAASARPRALAATASPRVKLAGLSALANQLGAVSGEDENAVRAETTQPSDAKPASAADAATACLTDAEASAQQDEVSATVAAAASLPRLTRLPRPSRSAATDAATSVDSGEITLALIPVGEPLHIATSLGIPYGVEACDVLSRRLTQKVDLGKINGQYFLSEVRIPMGEHRIEGEGMFRLSAQAADCEVIVSNLRSPETARCEGGYKLKPGDPQDGYLDVLVVPRQVSFIDKLKGRVPGPTVIPLKRLVVSSTKEDVPVEAFVDGVRMAAPKLIIEIDSDKLRLISGRERMFGES